MRYHLTPDQVTVFLRGYLAYRMIKPALIFGKFKNFNAANVAAAIGIESKLAVRPGAARPALTAASVGSSYTEIAGAARARKRAKAYDNHTKTFIDKFTSNSNLTKKDWDEFRNFQKPENEAKARAALETFLKSAMGSEGWPVGGQVTLDRELKLLGNYLAAKVPGGGVRWVHAPLKAFDRAWDKTRKTELTADVNYRYQLNKDLARGTLACNSKQSLSAVVKLLKETCTNAYNMSLLGDGDGDWEQRSEHAEPPGKSTSGYSGWNFPVVFREHVAFAAEIQANTYDVLYGKMGMAEYCKHLQVSESVYLDTQARMMFPGGLGHALYVMQDSRTKQYGVTKEEADKARSLSLCYYDWCRGGDPKPRNGWGKVKLNAAILSFGAGLTSAKAKEIWKEAAMESGWATLMAQARLLSSQSPEKPA